eukprot:4282813-Prymnesium_polylepis.2
MCTSFVNSSGLESEAGAAALASFCPLNTPAVFHWCGDWLTLPACNRRSCSTLSRFDAERDDRLPLLARDRRSCSMRAMMESTIASMWLRP